MRRYQANLIHVLLAAGLSLAWSGCDRRAPQPPPTLDLNEAPAADPAGPSAAPPVRLEPSRAPFDAGPPLGQVAEQVTRAVADRAGLCTSDQVLLEMQAARRAAAKQPSTGAVQDAAARAWEIQFFKGNTIEMYARQLEFFGLELGLVLPDNKIAYILHPTKPKPEVRTAPAAQETRAYLSWSRGDLVEADRNLAKRAGLAATDRVILCFLPPKVEATLAELEKKQAGDKLPQVTKTRFGVRRKGDDYEVYVIEQTFRTAAGGAR